MAAVPFQNQQLDYVRLVRIQVAECAVTQLAVMDDRATLELQIPQVCKLLWRIEAF